MGLPVAVLYSPGQFAGLLGACIVAAPPNFLPLVRMLCALPEMPGFERYSDTEKKRKGEDELHIERSS